MIERQSQDKKQAIQQRKELAQLLVESALDRAQVLGVGVIHGDKNGKNKVVLNKTLLRYQHEDELGY